MPSLNVPWVCADELVLVDAAACVEELDVRHGRLADADGADLLGLDQPDRQQPAPSDAGQRGRRHPAGGAAADDDDRADARGLVHAATGAAQARRMKSA